MKHAPGFLKLVEEVMARVREVQPDDVKARLDALEPFLLVDVREESEWAAGHIPGAIHLSRGIIERDVEGAIPDKAAHIVLYCGGGYRSALVADSLQKMGYFNVLSMAEGWRGWNERNFPRTGA